MADCKVEFNYEIENEAAEINLILKKLFSDLKNNIPEKYFSELEFKIELAAREILANAIEYGGNFKANSPQLENFIIKINMKITEKNLIFQVMDPGRGFDWENYDFKTMPLFSERGRGLKMVKKVADKIEFNKKGNQITAYFRFS